MGSRYKLEASTFFEKAMVRRAGFVHTGCGCGSKMGAQNGSLVNGTHDYNRRSPGGLMLPHTHVSSGGRSVRKFPSAEVDSHSGPSDWKPNLF